MTGKVKATTELGADSAASYNANREPLLRHSGEIVTATQWKTLPTLAELFQVMLGVYPAALLKILMIIVLCTNDAR